METGMHNGYSAITVAAQANNFGAAITGVDLAQPLPAAVLAEIRQAWAQYAVVCFPGQPLTHAQLEAFTLQLGEFGVDPYIKAMPDQYAYSRQ